MKRSIAIAFVALLSACGGGGSNGSSVPSAKGASAPAVAHSAVTFTLHVPSPATSASVSRRALYVSPSTVSVVVALTEQDGAAVSPHQQYAVTVSGIAGCYPMPESVARSPQAVRKPLAPVQGCTFTIPAPVGVDTFSVSAYDAAQTSATPTTLTGKLLSTGSVATTVLPSSPNDVSLTLGGVVASLSLVLTKPNPYTDNPAPIDLVLQAFDADGNVIVGAGDFATSVTLTNSDLSGATSLSTTSVTSPGTSVTVAWTGAPTKATFTASATGVTPATATLASQTSRIYVVNENANTIKTYDVDGNPTTPTISTGSNPQDIKVDASGKIYVVNEYSDSVTTYLPDGTPTTPIITGLNEPRGMAIDASGKIYVADFYNGEVKTFLADGTQTTPTITSNDPSSVSVDATGNIYVESAGDDTVTVYNASGIQIGAPISVAYPAALFFDSGKLYVASYYFANGAGLGSVTTYLANLTPTTPTITAGIDHAGAVVVDPAGKIYVTNSGSDTVTTYNADGSQTTPTITTGLDGPTGVAVY